MASEFTDDSVPYYDEPDFIRELQPLEVSDDSLLADEPPASETFGAKGGILRMGRHRLMIQRKSVLRSTLFTIERRPQTSRLILDLRANDQEEYAFFKPVLLVFSYAKLGISNPDDLLIVQVNSNGDPVSIVGGVVDRDAETVTAALDHFSGYALATG